MEPSLNQCYSCPGMMSGLLSQMYDEVESINVYQSVSFPGRGRSVLFLPFLSWEMSWEFNINCSALSFGQGSSSYTQTWEESAWRAALLLKL